MRLICHIGHHKTGTTSLQAFLSQNSQKLLKAGILYPWVESQGAAYSLAKAIKNEDKAEILHFNIREAHNALAFRMLADTVPGWAVPSYHRNLPHSHQMLLALHNQIEALQPDHVVLCSEVMSHFGKVAHEQILRLRREGASSAQQMTLWCTLRRPDEQLASWHGQQIRFGLAPKPLSDAESGLNLEWLHFDYRGVVEPWLKLLPGMNAKLRPYRETLVEGGSVGDFIRHSEIAFPPGLLNAPTLNVSLKPAVLTLLREANRMLPRPLAEALAKDIETLTEGMKLAGTFEVEFFGPQSRASLMEHFRPIHEWLSQTAGRNAFFCDLDEMERCKPIAESEALQQLLDQLTPNRIARIGAPEIREFLTRMCRCGTSA